MLTRLVNVLFKKILYSLQILANSVPKATTNANLLVQFLACEYEQVKLHM